MRLPVEVVRRVRAAVGPDFIMIYRISLIDLVPDGRPGPRWCSWPKPSRRRARRCSTPGSAGTRRGCRRLPHRSRAAPSPGSREAAGEVGIPSSPRTGSTRPRWPRRCWPKARRHGVDGAAVSGRPDFVAKARGGKAKRDRALHRLQSGLSGPYLRGQADHLPCQPARLPSKRNCVYRRPTVVKRVAVVGAGLRA
jgi:2,4-dienoyl-CoA reductase (NADPH2)